MKEDKTTNPERNTPVDKGKNDDPNVRDDSGVQPGVSTVSKSDYDDDNQKPTKTASDNFRTEPADKNADAAFDDISQEED